MLNLNCGPGRNPDIHRVLRAGGGGRDPDEFAEKPRGVPGMAVPVPVGILAFVLQWTLSAVHGEQPLDAALLRKGRLPWSA